jgi:hypothetical protein
VPKTYTDAEAPSNSGAAPLEMVISDSGRVNLASSLRAGALLRASTCSGRRACHAEAWRRRVAREIRAIAAPNAFGAASYRCLSGPVPPRRGRSHLTGYSTSSGAPCTSVPIQAAPTLKFDRTKRLGAINFIYGEVADAGSPPVSESSAIPGVPSRSFECNAGGTSRAV